MSDRVMRGESHPDRGPILPGIGPVEIQADGTVLVDRPALVEEPNSDAVLGMIDLVTIQQAYAANVDALKAMDGVLATVARAGREGLRRLSTVCLLWP